MPNIKDLFKKHDSSGKVLSANNINELTSSQDAESLGQIQALQVEKDRFFPEVDFSKPETFVRYGSAEKYYENAITAIYRMYPYDGSLQEKTQWHNSSSYFDNYIFDNLYPRTNGYLSFGPDTTPAGMTSFYNGNNLYDKSGTPQYIYIKGGPNTAGVADKEDQTLAQKFNTKSSKTSYTETSANIYDASPLFFGSELVGEITTISASSHDGVYVGMAMVKTKVLDTEDTKLSVIPDDPEPTIRWSKLPTHIMR